MERVNFGYSVKNIPTTSERTYKLKLIESIEAVIKRIRWEKLFFKPNTDDSDDSDDEPEKRYPNIVRKHCMFI